MRFLDRLGSRPGVILAGWAVAAVLAVLVGVVGIGLVGAGLTSGQGAPVSEAEVLRELDRLGSAPPASPGSASPGSASPGSASPTRPAVTGRSFATRAGTVVADCDRILSMAPALGYEVHEQEGREGEFRNVRDGKDRLEVELRCAGGVPQLTVTDDD